MNRIASLSWIKTIHRCYVTNISSTDKPALRPKTPRVQKITVLTNETRMETTLVEAQKLAKRRDLHLVEVEQSEVKTHRPTYRLLTKTEMLEQLDTGKNNNTTSNEPAKISHEKAIKSLTINARISDNDLKVRLTQINKWLVKGHDIRILLQSSKDDSSNSENICKKIDQSIKEPKLLGKLTQKRTKGSMIRFNLIPQTDTLSPINDADVKHKS